ncbi:MAG: hypothetical protein R3F53_19310 [Gammaproteobacteria bacterium]
MPSLSVIRPNHGHLHRWAGTGHTGIVHSLIISTADAGLARVLSRLDPAQLVKRRWGEASINFPLRRYK